MSPRKAPKVCSSPGCPELVTDRNRSQCPDCRRRYDRERGSAASRGYGPSWRRQRAAFLRRHPTCVDCGRPSEEADHAPLSRRELVGRGVHNPDADQYLQARCKPCHSRRTVAEDGAWQR